MPLYKFGVNDIFRNRVKTHPRTSFVINEGRVVYNGEVPAEGLQDSTETRKINHTPSGHISLYEMNVDRDESSHDPDALNPTMVYPFITKQGSLTSFKTVSTTTFQSYSYGDILSSSYPLSSSIAVEHHVAAVDSVDGCLQNRRHITALRNTFEHYKYLSPYYAWESDSAVGTWNKGTQEMALVSVPSIFYGSSIKKGSVDLKFYIDGKLIARLQDTKRNGELIQTVEQPQTTAATAASIVVDFDPPMGSGFTSGDPFDNKRIIIEDAEGTTKTFIFDNDVGSEGPTGTVDGSGFIVVQVSGLFGNANRATQFAQAVNSVADLKISASDDGAANITLTQDVLGSAGNTQLFNPDSIFIETSSTFVLGDFFEGGADATSGDSHLGEVAGVVLYNEGVLALTGSWALHDTYTDYFRTCPDCISAMDTDGDGTAEPISPSWTLWGSQGDPTDTSCNLSAGKLLTDPSVTLCPSASWSIDFQGTNYVSVLTMLAHAPKGDLNHSNNPTYVKYSEEEKPVVDNTRYIERNDKEIKNIVKSVHTNYSESFEKTTYISKVGIYDEDKNLIAIAKVATPVKKTTDREYTFKIKLDF